jgi:hypothetical protein
MKRQPVTSDFCRAVAYDPARLLLEIEFSDGRVYRYADVPLEIYEDLLHSEDKRDYFECCIQEQYAFTEMP